MDDQDFTPTEEEFSTGDNLNQDFSNEQQAPPVQDSYGGPVIEKLPNDPLALILSIVAIVLCCGPIGLVMNIITLNMAKKGMNLFDQNPGKFDQSSYNNMNITKIISIIGIVLSAIGIIFYIVYFGAIMAAIGIGGMQ